MIAMKAEPALTYPVKVQLRKVNEEAPATSLVVQEHQANNEAAERSIALRLKAKWAAQYWVEVHDANGVIIW